MTPNITKFLEGTGTDHKGRFITDIWKFDDKEIEHNHDFIQWIFPLNEPSMSVFGAPVLDKEDIDTILSNEVAQTNITKSAEWYLGFLMRNENWIKSYDHNHLRITRTIKSLRLLVGDYEANKFRKNLLFTLGDKINTVKSSAIKFWNNS